MKIDAHNHFWIYTPESHAWIDQSMHKIQRNFLPEDLEKLLREQGVAGTIAVQAEQSESETVFLLELADRFDFIRGVVGWLDLRNKALESRLEFFSQFKKLVGFRHIVQSEPDPNFLLDGDFQRGIRLLTEFNFTYDLLIYPKQLDAALKTVRLNPEQKFVIDHIAKPNIQSGEILDWAKRLREIAGCDNVMCKLSGIVTQTDWNNWKKSDFTPYLDVVLDAFGTDRVMFGSDWPVCLVAASYREVYEIITEYVVTLSKSERAKVFGLNAARFYNIQM